MGKADRDRYKNIFNILHLSILQSTCRNLVEKKIGCVTYSMSFFQLLKYFTFYKR